MSSVNTSYIAGISFGVLSPEEIRKMSVCEVNAMNIYDKTMGTISKEHNRCVKCDLPSKMCPGHFGHIELKEHILHPLFKKKYVVPFLKCFCSKCKRLVVDAEHINVIWGHEKMKVGYKRFTKNLALIEKKIYECVHCKSNHYKYVIKEEVIFRSYKERDAGINSVPVEVPEIEELFNEISDEDVALLGLDPKLVHPRNLILSVFPVLPPCARPYIISDGNICDDDLTIQILEIIKDNAKIEKARNENDKEKLKKSINSLIFHVSTFYQNKGQAKRPTDNQVIKGLKERLAGKGGQVRHNNMGKRVDFSGRTVIGANPNLKLGEMALPKEMAMRLTYPEKAIPSNIALLQSYVNDGKVNSVLRMKDGIQTTINMQYALNNRGTELKLGDIIVRGEGEIENGEITLPEKTSSSIKVYFASFGNEGEKVGSNVVVGKDRKLKQETELIQQGDLIITSSIEGDPIRIKKTKDGRVKRIGNFVTFSDLEYDVQEYPARDREEKSLKKKYVFWPPEPMEILPSFRIKTKTERCFSLIKGEGSSRSEEDSSDLTFIHFTGTQSLIVGDRLIRNGKLVENVSYPSKRFFKVQEGDIVERHLRNGDYVLLNRQPTLHRGSMLGMKIVILPSKTIQFCLAAAKTYNADFDRRVV